jgi:O-antigen/teichoic acid export membrane protein
MTIGKVYKPATLAYYDRAYTYSGLVTQVVNTSISSVLLPVFSRSQDDKSHIKEMARRSVSMSAFVMIPVLLLVALVSKPLILIVLTDKWLPCAPFLSLFCLLRIPGIITSVDKQVYLSLWKSQIGLYYEMILLAINLLSLVLMIPYGVFAIAIGYVVVEFAGNFMLCVISDKVYNYSLIERTKDLIKPVFSSIIMLACGYLLSLIELPLWMTLICQVLVCSVIYLFMQYILRDSSLAFIINKFRKK